jgi:hypothetical protein
MARAGEITINPVTGEEVTCVVSRHGRDAWLRWKRTAVAVAVTCCAFPVATCCAFSVGPARAAGRPHAAGGGASTCCVVQRPEKTLDSVVASAVTAVKLATNPAAVCGRSAERWIVLAASAILSGIVEVLGALQALVFNAR